MGVIVHYFLVVALIITGQLTCYDARDTPGNKELTAKPGIILDKDSALTANDNIKSTLLPLKSSDAIKTTTLATPGVVTVTAPPIPSPATASPGGNDVSKIINLLFAILLAVTAILMAITGACMFGLRRRYLFVSNHSKYKQLEEMPI